MKKGFAIIALFVLILGGQTARSQDVYPVSSFEHLYQFVEVEREGFNTTNKMRYTIVFNFAQYWHMDFNNNIGLYSGLGIRNVGFIYDRTDAATGQNPRKTIRRSYTIGVPLALKIGVFDKHLYVSGGAEYELLYVYKGKAWDSHSRSGTKYKEVEWFSGKTKRFVPSVFAGVQFPGGFNLKGKYYLDHFLNTSYVGPDLGEQNVSFADYKKINMFYVSLSWQFRTDQWMIFIFGIAG